MTTPTGGPHDGRHTDDQIRSLPHVQALMRQLDRTIDAALEGVVLELGEREGVNVTGPDEDAAYDRYLGLEFRAKRAILQGLLNRHMRG